MPGGLLSWVCGQPACLTRQMDRALVVGGVVKYVPLPSQVLFEESPAKNVLWGGQAGPGKSHGARWWLYKRSLTVPGHEALIAAGELGAAGQDAHPQDEGGVADAGAKLVDRTAVFPNGSFIDCGHMADVEAVGRYLSTEYGAIVPDEASCIPWRWTGRRRWGN
jgi:hypothetical protein